MHHDRSRYGLLVSALGAVLLAVSVFLPWYALSFTPSGIAAAQRAGEQAAAQLGDPTLQSFLAPLRVNLSSLAGVQFASESGHQALHYMGIVLLVLAALALLDCSRSPARMPCPRAQAARSRCSVRWRRRACSTG